MRILLVEDELFLANTVVKYLKKHNMEVDSEYDGQKALDMIINNNYDLVILDIMLPNMSGVEILENIRSQGLDTPVILATAKSTVEDKINGLSIGADDYITKPYDLSELIARINANVRRTAYNYKVDQNNYGDLIIVRDNLTISKGSDSLTLTLKEFNILEFLLSNKNVTISKERIVDKVWGYDTDILPSQIEVYISYLRKKLKILNSNVQIKTIRNVGYTVEYTDV